MKYLVAILLPPLGMLLAGRVMLALLCVLLMVTLIGWPIAAIWAVVIVNSAENEKRMRKMLEQERRRGG
jgi:uncharacterized membrane protein YqaE (UPF0057 family)